MCVIDHLRGDSLNVRSGPGTGYGVVGSIPFDAVNVMSAGLVAKDDQERNWLVVRYGSTEGWSAGWLLVPCEVIAAADYCVIDTTCDDRLNVRLGPGTGYDRIGSLSFNATGVEATGAVATDANERVWRQIRHYRDVGWVAGWFVTEAPCSASAGLPCSLPGGPVAPDCINGWTTPAASSALWEEGLSAIGVGVGGNVDASSFVVEDMRYFVGPQDAHTLAPRPIVHRWYIKGYSETDPAYRGRWLVIRRDPRPPGTAGLGWIAPYGSAGWGPGTWEGSCPDGCILGPPLVGERCSVGCGGDPQEVPCYPINPGTWSPGDCSGLPPEVLGCVAGT